jgi:ATP-dependent DNA helicase RecG
MIDLNEIFKSSEKVNVEVNAAQGGIPNSIWETYSSLQIRSAVRSFSE